MGRDWRWHFQAELDILQLQFDFSMLGLGRGHDLSGGKRFSPNRLQICGNAILKTRPNTSKSASRGQ
jgi:hypothetical protein